MMTGILNKNGLKAKLIQSSDEFDLYNLYELRTFLSILFPTAIIASIISRQDVMPRL